MEHLPNRKPNRLHSYDYSSIGAYFVTICVQDMRCILSSVVGDPDCDLSVGDADPGVPSTSEDAKSGPPRVLLSAYGKIVAENLERMNTLYAHIRINRFVIMPNHVHLLISVRDEACGGTPGSASPTADLTQVSPTTDLTRFIAAFKKYTDRACGMKLWQRSFHDHVIRSDEDYRLHWQYIDENPKKWIMGKDAYYGYGSV